MGWRALGENRKLLAKRRPIYSWLMMCGTSSMEVADIALMPAQLVLITLIIRQLTEGYSSTLNIGLPLEK